MKIEIVKTELVDVKYVGFEIMVSIEDFEFEETDKDTLNKFFETDIFSCAKEDVYDTINVMIDVDSKKLVGWMETNDIVSIFAKVRDEGIYRYYDKDKNVVLEKENEYVPDFLQVEENGFGDYLNMIINKDGVIENFNIDKIL